ncbi:MAG: DUF3768 domain-containing protein [bacterium]
MSIAERNDAFRRSIPYSDNPRNKVFLTRGIFAEYSDSEIADIITMVRNFGSFNEENNCYGENDFGKIVYLGRDIFWKIDDYAGQEDTELVMTIMLSEEY